MRDPNRIRKFCEELASIWEIKCPDWRFGQLIVNIFGDRDPFYMEDDAAMQKIRNFFQKEGEGVT